MVKISCTAFSLLVFYIFCYRINQKKLSRPSQERDNHCGRKEESDEETLNIYLSMTDVLIILAFITLDWHGLTPYKYMLFT